MPDQPLPLSPQDIERRREAEAALRRVKLDSDSIGRSALARLETVAAEDDGKIELWGRRIGRALGAIAVLALLWQLTVLLFASR